MIYRRSLSLLIFLLVAFAILLLLNTVTFRSLQVHYAPAEKIQFEDSIAEHLAAAIRFNTISYQNEGESDSLQFTGFLQYLKKTYPLAHSKLERTIINDHNLLYMWIGSDNSLPPALLSAHFDVPPVPSDDLEKWTFPPFDGVVHDDMIYGRGSRIGKIGVIGIFEAIEYLLQNKYEPQRTIIAAFSHVMDPGEKKGAGVIADYLHSKEIRPAFVLTEGSYITRGWVPGVLTDLALIGIAEKAEVSLELKVINTSEQTTSSTEDIRTRILENAISRLQNNPFPAKMTNPLKLLNNYIGPEMRFQDKFLIANNFLFENTIKNQYLKSHTMHGLVATRIEPKIETIYNSNTNVPGIAANVCFKILPGTTAGQIVEYTKKTIKDHRIAVRLHHDENISYSISSVKSFGYEIINKSVIEIFPDVITAPSLSFIPSDARHYRSICDEIYQFIPIRLSQEYFTDTRHVDERISVEDFENAIRFYIRIIKNIN